MLKNSVQTLKISPNGLTGLQHYFRAFHAIGLGAQMNLTRITIGSHHYQGPAMESGADIPTVSFCADRVPAAHRGNGSFTHHREMDRAVSVRVELAGSVQDFDGDEAQIAFFSLDGRTVGRHVKSGRITRGVQRHTGGSLVSSVSHRL
jgi:hypothetical protein